jgi:6-phosphogluconate dehydrogenase
MHICIGMVGLGRMGGNMARRLYRGGIEVLAFDRDIQVARRLSAKSGIRVAETLEALVNALPEPRILWLMLPAGSVTEQVLEKLHALLRPGDLIVDGANSHYRDSIRHGKALAEAGIEFVDAGISGGVWGLEGGYALMLGGVHSSVERLQPALEILAPAAERGWLHCGPVGSGHFVKMVHNGIEYGMMQAYAEGFSLLKARDDFALDVAAIAETWRHGSVVRSWLLDLMAEFLADDPSLEQVAPYAADSGAGRWTVIEAVEQGVPTPVISAALAMRFASQGQLDYSARLLAMMRRGFGGHPLGRPGEE